MIKSQHGEDGEEWLVWLVWLVHPAEKGANHQTASGRYKRWEVYSGSQRVIRLLFILASHRPLSRAAVRRSV